MKFENKVKKLGIENEVKSIIANCECGEINNARIIEVSKTRKWEIMEIIGNYFNIQERNEHIEETDWTDYKRLSSFCKAFGIAEFEIPIYLAQAICEDGYEIAYPIYNVNDEYCENGVVLCLSYEIEGGNLPEDYIN